MLPWKPFLAVVPAGLLLGLVAGQATRPVMLVKDDRPWPYAADETAREADRWPTFDLSTPDIASRGYSYRPDIDYDSYAWPDQTDRSAELLAADYDYDSPGTYAAQGQLRSRGGEPGKAFVPQRGPMRELPPGAELHGHVERPGPDGTVAARAE